MINFDLINKLLKAKIKKAWKKLVIWLFFEKFTFHSVNITFACKLSIISSKITASLAFGHAKSKDDSCSDEIAAS